jgi:hypothetical protein
MEPFSGLISAFMLYIAPNNRNHLSVHDKLKLKVRPYLKTILLYAIVIVAALVFFDFKSGGELLEVSNLLHWDAEHYQTISQDGYKGFLVAFFPALPMLWKTLSCGPLIISLLNALFFFLSFFMLVREFKVRNKIEGLLYLSIPSFIFFFLPYTESLFFLSASLMLIGLNRDKLMYVCFGLLLAVLARPAFTIILPALILAEVLQSDWRSALRNIAVYLGVAALGVVIVGYIQFLDTGAWFEFFTMQQGWGNELQIPAFPLTSWSDGIIIKLDAVAFLVGTLGGSFLLAYIIKRSFFKNTNLDKAQVFTFAYLGGITLLVLLFRGGSLFSLNRFVFATPFIIVAFHYWMRQNITFKGTHLLLIYALLSVFWLLFGSYVHIQEFLAYSLLSVYVLLLFAIKANANLVRKYSLLILVALNMALQVVLFVRFLGGQWVG